MDRTAQNAQLIAAIESGGHISEISRMLAAGASPRARKIVVLRARVRVDDAATPENGRPAWEWREDAVECEGPLALAVLRRRGDVVRALLSQRGSIGLVNGPVEWRVANWAIGARLWTRREWEQTRWFWTVRFPNALHLASGTGGTLTRWDGHKLVCPTEDYVVEVNLKGGVVQIVHPVGRDQAAVEVRLKWPGLGVMGSLVAKGARMEWKPTGPVEGPVKKSALLWGEMAAGRSSMESGSSSWATTIGGTESPVPTNYGVVEIVDHRETDRRTHHATLPQYTAPAARDLAASTEDSESDDKSSTSEWSTIPEDHDANGAAPAAEAVLEMVPVITGTNPQTNTTDDEAEEELQLNFDIISITEPANVDIDVDAPSSSGATWRRSESVVSLVPIAGACTVTEFGLVECNMGAAAVRVAVARVESASGGDVGYTSFQELNVAVEHAEHSDISLEREEEGADHDGGDAHATDNVHAVPFAAETHAQPPLSPALVTKESFVAATTDSTPLIPPIAVVESLVPLAVEQTTHEWVTNLPTDSQVTTTAEPVRIAPVAPTSDGPPQLSPLEVSSITSASQSPPGTPLIIIAEPFVAPHGETVLEAPAVPVIFELDGPPQLAPLNLSSTFMPSQDAGDGTPTIDTDPSVAPAPPANSQVAPDPVIPNLDDPPQLASLDITVALSSPRDTPLSTPATADPLFASNSDALNPESPPRLDPLDITLSHSSQSFAPPIMVSMPLVASIFDPEVPEEPDHADLKLDVDSPLGQRAPLELPSTSVSSSIASPRIAADPIVVLPAADSQVTTEPVALKVDGQPQPGPLEVSSAPATSHGAPLTIAEDPPVLPPFGPTLEITPEHVAPELDSPPHSANADVSVSASPLTVASASKLDGPPQLGPLDVSLHFSPLVVPTSPRRPTESATSSRAHAHRDSTSTLEDEIASLANLAGMMVPFAPMEDGGEEDHEADPTSDEEEQVAAQWTWKSLAAAFVGGGRSA